MKTFIAVLSALLFSTSYAQITLEHEIPDSNTYFTLIQVDSGEYYYMTQFYGSAPAHEGVDFKLFDLDYNLVKEINIPIDYKSPNYFQMIVYVSRRLFDLDDSLEYLVYNFAGGYQGGRHSNSNG
jgi:hypothetical protein